MSDLTLSEQIAELHQPADNVAQMRRINECRARAHQLRLQRDELLEALKAAEKWINECGKWPGRRAIADAFLPQVRAAIAKATEEMGA